MKLRSLGYLLLSLVTGPVLIPYIWLSKAQRSTIRPEDKVKVAIKHLAFVLVWVLAALILLGVLRLPV